MSFIPIKGNYCSVHCILTVESISHTVIHAKTRQRFLALSSENCKGKTEKKEEIQKQLN